jgi:hypothetical protein
MKGQGVKIKDKTLLFLILINVVIKGSSGLEQLCQCT